MRILFVCPKIANENYGAEKTVIQLARYCHTCGWDVFVATSFEKNIDATKLFGFQVKLLRLYKVNNKYLRKMFADYISFPNILLMIYYLGRYKITLAHVHNVYGIGACLAWVLKKFVPTVATIHDYFVLDYRGFTLKDGVETSFPILSYLHQKVMHFLYKEVVLVAPSQFLEIRLKKSGFRHVIHIYNGIEKKTLQKQDVQARSNIILWVGHIQPIKGLHEVLPTMREFLRLHPAYQFYIVGDGAQKDYLQSAYPEFQWKGFCNPEPYYAQASILLFSSICYENQPYVVCEAMMHGLCVIRNNIGSASEMFEDTRSGFLYSSQEHLRSILETLAENQVSIRSIGYEAHTFACNHYDADDMFLSYERIYKNLTR